MRSNRTRVLCIASIVVAGGAGGCSDTGTHPTVPSAPGTAAAGEPTPMVRRLTTGRVTLTVRRLGQGGPLGQVIHTETGSYNTIVEVDGRSAGRVSLPSGTFEQLTFGSDFIKRQRGRWTRSLPAGGAATATVQFSAAAGAPPSESEFRRGGVVISRTAKTWERADGGWRLREAVTTLYDRGVPVVSLTLAFDAGETSVLDAGRAQLEAVPAPDRPAFEYEDGSVCEAEVASMDAAFVKYEVSCAALLACLSPLFKLCAAAYGNLLTAGATFDASVVAVETCLAKA